jgi:hypothetical protein
MDRLDWLITVLLGLAIVTSIGGAYASLHKHHRLFLPPVEVQ